MSNMSFFEFKTKQQLQKNVLPENHTSKKKKNTYTIAPNTLTMAIYFSACPDTPLAVTEKNGKQIETTTCGWITAKPFPNPCAGQMATEYNNNKKIFGEKISTTIIEYLDKETNKPVLQVYPNTIYVFDGYEENFESHLNHATRKDLKKQLELRKKLLSQHIR